MKNRANIAKTLLNNISPLIQESILEDRNFRENYGIKPEHVITLNQHSVSFNRSDLFNSVRTAFNGDSVELADIDGRIWKLNKKKNTENVIPYLVLTSDKQEMNLPDYSALSGDFSTRIRSLEETAFEFNFPSNTREEWRSKLLERALDDYEVKHFQNEIYDTPVFMEENIRREIIEGKSSAFSLVPNSKKYFERLVGTYDGSKTIQDYAAGIGHQILEQLIEWRPIEGFLFALFLSSHSALTAEIKVDQIDRNDLIKAFDFLVAHGDILSRLGAVEVGLLILPNYPELEPFLVQLVHIIRDDTLDGGTSEFQLFSALFVLVEGEIARTRIFANEPPFYRRLASIAHAALIHRQLIKFAVDFQQFSDWALNICGERYFMQTLADMRTEPRWDPNMATAFQLKADFCGRLMSAGNKFKEILVEGELRNFLLGDKDQSLVKMFTFPFPYLPGPLEGSEDNPISVPDDLTRTIEEQLENDEVEAGSFIALVNSAMIFRLKPGHTELATKALKLTNYTLTNLKDTSHLLYILNGLSKVAAVSRNPELANELRILVRRYRKDTEYGFPIEETMKICLVAAASRKDLADWRQFVGEWLTELAFSELEENESVILHSHLLALLHSVPELWVTCSKADAALQALRNR